MKKELIVFCGTLLSLVSCYAQTGNGQSKFSRQDTLRGTNGPERSWWDVQHYDIQVTPDYPTKTISGKTTIEYKVVADRHSDYLQVDLQQPLILDSIFYNGKYYINYPGKPYYREGDVFHIPLPKAVNGSVQTISFYYHGKPVEAVNPPWGGGWIWKKDAQGRPWMSVACQGKGASVWYPCKDYQGDEPDRGATLTITIPDTLMAVGNGQLRNKTVKNDRAIYTWQVKNPINNYNIIPYIGKYVNWTETYVGEKGNLDLSYWVLDYNIDKAKLQFKQVPKMLKAFEYWFGPYPFYEDGYKLVEAPHLGMEHQSAVAYGNRFKNGYLGTDLSGTGQGLKWDFIIVHESGHEWFGNNITSKDIADMWVHEGFTNYSEVLFIDYYYGNEAGNEYVQGLRSKIANNIPIIGAYGVNNEGSGDMYPKGANLLHTIRQIINNDTLFRQILRGLNKDFYHQTVTTKQIEDYMSQKSGKDFSKVFDQYLRTTQIPLLSLKADGDKLKFQWTNCIPGFNMPVKLTNGQWIHPTTAEQKVKIDHEDFSGVTVDRNFYVRVKKD